MNNDTVKRIHNDSVASVLLPSETISFNSVCPASKVKNASKVTWTGCPILIDFFCYTPKHLDNDAGELTE